VSEVDILSQRGQCMNTPIDNRNKGEESEHKRDLLGRRGELALR